MEENKLEEWFQYDETSPSYLRWISSRWSGCGYGVEHVSAGQIAGCQDSKGQYQVNIDNKNIMVHRVIWQLFNGEIPEGFVIDHIDGNGSKNHIDNLRCVPPELNARNLKKYKTNSSGICGVSLLRNKTKDGYNLYWSAKWAGLQGQQINKRFPVLKHGYDVAFKLACEYRLKMITELNELGAGYTERHGT